MAKFNGKEILLAGLKGEKGDPGKSAYEYAKDAGYTGTESEFMKDSNPENLPDNIKENIADALETEKAAAVQDIRDESATANSEIEDAKAVMLSEIELAAEIVQSTGGSETAVMSQKATTDTIRDVEGKTYGVTVPVEWEIGALSATDGTETESAKRFRMTETATFDPAMILELDAGYSYVIFLFATSGTLTYSSTWKGSSTDKTILDFSSLDSAAATYRIMVRNYANTALGELSDEVKHVRLLRKAGVRKTTETLNDNMTNGNLFDPFNAIEGYGISSAGTRYAVSGRWCTGYIPVDSINRKGVIVTPTTSIRSYDENRAFIGTVSAEDTDGNMSFIEGTAFVCVQYANSTMPFEDRHRVTVCYSDDAERCLPFHVLKGEKLGHIDSQYFTKKDFARYANADGSFTTSFSRLLTAGADWAKNMIITAHAKYVLADGYTQPPTINFTGVWGEGGTTRFIIGANNEYETKEWRLPYFRKGFPSMKVVVTIPEGCTLYIDDFHNRFDDTVDRHSDGVRLNAHHGMSDLAPQGTKPAVLLAARLGYPCCIVTPKRTSDGVWIAYHDDTLESDTFIRQDDGSALPSEFFGKRFSAISYEDIKTWDFGIKMNYSYAGTRALTIDEFFKICGKTGMMPMLSIHPAEVVTESNMAEIKAIAKRYGVLGRLGIKIPTWSAGDTFVARGLQIAFNVFGYEIESYTLDLNTSIRTAELPIALFNGLNIDGTKVRRVIEAMASAVNDDMITACIEAGYEFAIANSTHTHPDGTSSGKIIGEEFEHWMALGVREYTDKYNYSSGLNW